MKKSRFLRSLSKTRTINAHFAQTQGKLIPIEYTIRKLILLWIFDKYFPQSSLNQGNPRQNMRFRFRVPFLLTLRKAPYFYNGFVGRYILQVAG